MLCGGGGVRRQPDLRREGYLALVTKEGSGEELQSDETFDHGGKRAQAAGKSLEL